MGLTSRRKRALNATKSPFRDTRLIVVATEGELTEPQYFRMFGNSRVQIRILPTVGGLSAPKHVLARIKSYKKEFQIGREDQLWLVIDVDRWGAAQLAEVAQKARQANLRLAVSNRCFEIWLLLHHEDIPVDPQMSGAEAEVRLRAILGEFNSSNLQTAHFQPHLETAIQRALKLDLTPTDVWPNKNGSHVYRLMQEVLRLSVPQPIPQET